MKNLGPVDWVFYRAYMWLDRFYGGGTLMLVLTDSQKVEVVLAPKTAAGNPAVVDVAAGVVFESSDPTVLEVLGDPVDPLRATARAVGPLGFAQITARADADLGAGTREIVAVDTVEVKAGEAVTLGLTFGAPVEQ